METIVNGGQLEFNDSIDMQPKVAVNSIQRTLLVERLCINRYYGGNYIVPFDVDNLYPNKIKAIAQRSGTTISAIDTLATFIAGNGFAGMDTIVNRDGQSLWEVVRGICKSIATFNGFALHFNYNLFGSIVEINLVNFEFVRRARNLNTLYVNPDWSKRKSQVKDEVEYMPYNPLAVKDEIRAAGGLKNYKGQLLYWIPNVEDIYCPCRFDAVLDDAQFEAEAKLYSLSGVQNDYSLSGILAYPEGITNKKQIENIQKDIAKDKGAANAGGIRVVGATLVEGLTNWKWFTPIARNNIDNLHKNQKDDAKFNIYAAFRQPPILNGVATQGMFNQESFADAFHYYNTATETERKDVEKIINMFLAHSIYNIVIEIQPKQFMLRDAAVTKPAALGAPIEAEQQVNSTLTNLTGRQLEGVFRITRKFKKGELTKEQAAIMLKNGFAFNDEQIEVWLINDDE